MHICACIHANAHARTRTNARASEPAFSSLARTNQIPAYYFDGPAITIAGPALGLQHIHTSAANRAGEIGADNRRIAAPVHVNVSGCCSRSALASKREGHKNIRISRVLRVNKGIGNTSTACEWNHPEIEQFRALLSNAAQRLLRMETWNENGTENASGTAIGKRHCIFKLLRLGCTHRNSGTIKSYCSRYCNDQDISTQGGGSLHV
jgi:hypothetical protein